MTRSKNRKVKQPRLEHKFLLKAILNHFTVNQIDFLLNLLFKRDICLDPLSGKYRRKIENCKKDHIKFEIETLEFLCMLSVSLQIWPTQLIGQSGLCFSRINDQGSYKLENTILLPHGLNSNYARSMQNLSKDPEHLLLKSAIDRLHVLVIYMQHAVLKNKTPSELEYKVTKTVKNLITEIALYTPD